MPEDIHEECGLAAIVLRNKPKKDAKTAPYYLIKMLLQQQHRGQAAAGISTYNKARPTVLKTFKGLGTVHEAFKLGHQNELKQILKDTDGSAGIGHVRYATLGSDDVANAHPLERPHGRSWKWFSIAFNGNLANYVSLRRELEKAKYSLIRESDTEVIMHFLAKQQVGERKTNMADAFSKLSKKFDGAYNVVYLNAEGTVIAVRDPLGFRPFSYSIGPNSIQVASESCAFTNGLRQHKYRALEPGQMLIAENGHAKVKRFAKCKRKAHCMFEWVYFANPVSVIDNINVYKARIKLGRELAYIETENTNKDDYIIVPVPDTARPAAEGVSQVLGLPVMEGLIRNRYVGRTFIETANREERAYEKYSIVKSILRGKKVILVEDSIVRGTTTRTLVRRLKKEGKAKEVHVRSSCPPIVSPCFYGIDMTSMDELIAPQKMNKEEFKNLDAELSEKTMEKIRKDIGADSLIYQSRDGLVNAINCPGREKNLCMACLNGKYPTAWGKMLLNQAKQSFGKKGKGRIYECVPCDGV